MKAKTSDKNKCGIYLIRNQINGKVYIGKSVNIYRRIYAHINGLNNKRLKHENLHFINAWHKEGKDNFAYVILKECNFDELKDLELFYMDKYKSCDPKYGYNKRRDSEGGMIPHEETRKKLANASRKRWSNEENRKMLGKKSSDFWKSNPDIKKKMAKKVKEKKEKFRFFKMNEDETIISVYETMEQLINENPTYKWQNIYSVCNGYKKRIYGFKWKKELKI